MIFESDEELYPKIFDLIKDPFSPFSHPEKVIESVKILDKILSRSANHIYSLSVPNSYESESIPRIITFYVFIPPVPSFIGNRIKCPKCGQVYRMGASFCNRCSIKLGPENRIDLFLTIPWDTSIFIVGFFDQKRSEKDRQLAVFFTFKCVQFLNGVIGLKPKKFKVYYADRYPKGEYKIDSENNRINIFYRDPGIPKKWVIKIARDYRNEIDSSYKQIKKEIKKQQLTPQNIYLKCCENCGQLFEAHRNDARACKLSACKKALSRKNRIREYRK